MTPTQDLMRNADLRRLTARKSRNKLNQIESTRLKRAYPAMRALEGVVIPENVINTENAWRGTLAEGEKDMTAQWRKAMQNEMNRLAKQAAPAASALRSKSQSPPSRRRLEQLLREQRIKSKTQKSKAAALKQRITSRLEGLPHPADIFLPEHAKFAAFKDRIKALDTFNDLSIDEKTPVETDYDTYKKHEHKFTLLEERAKIMNPPLPEENGIKYNASSPALNMKRGDSEYYARVKEVHDRIHILQEQGIKYINETHELAGAAPTLVAELRSVATRLHMAAHVAIKENINFVEDILLRTANTRFQLMQAIIAKNTPLKTEIGATLGRLKAFEDRQSLLREMPENTPEAMQTRLSEIETLQGMLTHVTNKGEIYSKKLKVLGDFITGYGSNREKYEANIARIKEKIMTLGKGKTVEKGLSATLKGLLPTIQERVNAAEAAAEASVAAEEAVAGAAEAGAPPRTKPQARALLASLETVVDECVGLAPSSINADNPNLEQDIREINAILQKLGAVQASLMASPPEMFEVLKPGIGALLEVDITAMDQAAVNTAINTKISALRTLLEKKEEIFRNLDGLKLSKKTAVYNSYADQCAVEMLALVRAFPAKPPAATPAETNGAKVMATLLY